MRIEAVALGLALAWAAIGGARATEVQFTISDGSLTTTFELDPTSGLGATGVFVFFPSVSVTVGGSPATPANVTFWNEGFGGGFVTDGFVFTDARQFYSGPETSPTFAVRTYTGLVNGFGGNTDTVTVAELPPILDPPDPPALGVPEPSTWAMLLLGFVGLSYAGYKKAKTRTTVSA